MNYIRLIMLVIVIFCSKSVLAFTGNQLLNYCKANDYFSRGMCLGYINGATDRDLDSSGCLPPNVTFGQMQKITESYLNSHPKLLHLHATFLVMLALNDAFPCSKTEKIN
jgi:Rap1a immunity proteins